jgi:hypothetical protein
MMDYSGNIVHDAAVRGQVPALIINELQLLTADMTDMTHDCNFHQVLTSQVVVSSTDTSLSGHVQLCKTAPIDFMTLATRWMIAPEHAEEVNAIEYAVGHTHLLEPDACMTILYQ